MAQNNQTWVGGPTHTIQRQHIPGYCGHIPHLKAETLFAKPFAKITNQCLTQDFDQQQDLSQRYKTIAQSDFAAPPKRSTFQVASQQVVQQEVVIPVPLSFDDIAPIDRVPVVGYQGFRPKYRFMQKQLADFNASQQQSNVQVHQHDNQENPIVGYTGFIPRIKANNLYAKSYKDTLQDSYYDRVN